VRVSRKSRTGRLKLEALGTRGPSGVGGKSSTIRDRVSQSLAKKKLQKGDELRVAGQTMEKKSEPGRFLKAEDLCNPKKKRPKSKITTEKLAGRKKTGLPKPSADRLLGAHRKVKRVLSKARKTQGENVLRVEEKKPGGQSCKAKPATSSKRNHHPNWKKGRN